MNKIKQICQNPPLSPGFKTAFARLVQFLHFFSTIGANFQRIHVMKTRGWFIHFRGRQPNFIGFCWKVGYSKVFHCSTIHGSWGVPLGELEELIFSMQSKKEIDYFGRYVFCWFFVGPGASDIQGCYSPRGLPFMKGPNLIYFHLAYIITLFPCRTAYIEYRSCWEDPCIFWRSPLTT